MNYATLSRGTSQMDPASVSASLSPAARTTVKTASTPRRDFDYGEPFTEAVMEHILELLP